MFSIIASQLKVPDIDNLNHIYGVHASLFPRTGETNPSGIYFRDDGKKLYIVGFFLDEVAEFDLYNPFDLSNITLKNTFSVASQETGPNGVFFKDDGTKMYIIGSQSDQVRGYDLSTAWDISTASYSQAFSTSSQDGNMADIFFKPDGTRFYLIGIANDTVYEYGLTSAWDISTASFTQSFDVSTQEAAVRGLFFKPDGTKMYVIGSTGDDINEYDLSTAWDISTASFNNVSPSIVVNETFPDSMSITSDGSVVYVLGRSRDAVQAFNLSTPWDITTLSIQEASKDYLDISSVQIGPQGITFKPDGTELYIVGSQADRMHQYTLSTPWDITSGSTPVFKYLGTNSGLPNDITFKPDGTKMYVIDGLVSNDDIDEYDLSTAWDITTASYVQSFSVASQDDGPQDLEFKPDGTKVFVIGQTNDAVYEYALSTAWDISTASFTTSFSVASQDSTPKTMVILESGLIFYILGTQNDRLHQYAMSTAWDLSTASFTKTTEKIKAIQLYDTAPHGMFLKPDQTKLWVIGNNRDSINAFSLI